MSSRLMDADDLKRVTGKVRHSKQADWFKSTFSVDVARDGNGAVVMTWQTFEALTAKRAGLNPDAQTDAAPVRPKVYPLRRASA